MMNSLFARRFFRVKMFFHPYLKNGSTRKKRHRLLSQCQPLFRAAVYHLNRNTPQQVYDLPVPDGAFRIIPLKILLNALFHPRNRSILIQIDFLIFDRSPQAFDKNIFKQV